MSEIAWKNGIPSFESRPPSGWVSLMISVLPRATTPDAVFAVPAIILSAPTMSPMNGTAGDCIDFVSARKIALWKFFAVIASPFESLRPLLILKV